MIIIPHQCLIMTLAGCHTNAAIKSLYITSGPAGQERAILCKLCQSPASVMIITSAFITRDIKIETSEERYSYPAIFA